MSISAEDRGGRAQSNGDGFRGRVSGLVEQGRQLEQAMLRAVDEQAMARQAEKARYDQLIGRIRYAVTASHFSSGGSVNEVRRLLDEFFGVVQVTPEAAAAGGPPPARPLPAAYGQGSGTPDDWPDQHPAWMDPNHELTHYDQLGIPEAQLEYPRVSGGVADLYASPMRVMWVR